MALSFTGITAPSIPNPLLLLPKNPITFPKPLKLHHHHHHHHQQRSFLLPLRASTVTTHHNAFTVADIVTPEFFNGIISKASAKCEGKGFYTLDAFFKALESYPDFARAGSPDDSLREIAAFFAHATLETGHFCYINQVNGKVYCEENPDYPCNPEKKYLGRGPLQLTWNYNYGLAGQKLGFDGLNSPELISQDPVLCFKASLWFWMTYVHKRFISGEGFGDTIRVINPGVCNGRFPKDVKGRVGYYLDYCGMFGVQPGDKLCC
ncbi:endochitinase EP3-like [Dioscorea cayenensis subsp. rotundata]|uniref:chitinase n=1 Tax=Dioscorea cayennensis subsp. rotundata TaxID=55577 RepID=A0AB40BBA6_DIOCR|nr:endochitinase EP3-like [Dioscorea cayenensis subsp. rotundata]